MHGLDYLHLHTRVRTGETHSCSSWLLMHASKKWPDFRRFKRVLDFWAGLTTPNSLMAGYSLTNLGGLASRNSKASSTSVPGGPLDSLAAGSRSHLGQGPLSVWNCRKECVWHRHDTPLPGRQLEVQLHDEYLPPNKQCTRR